MILTQSDLNLLRVPNHRTKLSMSIYRPRTLLACQVNNSSIGRGARTIAFDTVSTGSYSNVYANALMYVGTRAGWMDIGRIRVRSATASTLTVAENADIDWRDNLYLTVVDFIEISAIYPRIIKDPANSENVIFYKDYDVAYTNQNSVLGTFVCMGSHRAAYLENGQAQIYWTSSGTSNVNGDALTYSWIFDGATTTGSTSADPGYISYTTPGYYKTRLTVSNASGGSDTSYRYVCIHDKPENGTNVPILKWEMNGLSESRDSGGCEAQFRIFENIADIHPNALVILWGEDWYGDTKASIPNNQVNNGQTKFVGYVLENSIKYNYKDGWVEFKVASPTEIMKNCEGFSVSVESSGSPNTWFKIKRMNTAKALYHYLRWHSTVLNVTDFHFTDTAKDVQYFDSDRTSLYDAISNFLDTGIIGTVISDRLGSIWAEVSPPAIDDSHSLTKTFTIAKNDWMNEPSITENRIRQMSWVELGGVAYNAISGNSTPLLSNAPGIAPSYQGKPETKEGLILTSQNQLNILSGNYLQYKNATYPDVTFEMVGNYNNYDIAPVERTEITLLPSDTRSGIEIASGSFHVSSIEWQYSPKDENFRPTIHFHELTEGIPGITIVIPPVPNDAGYHIPSYDVDIPSLPPLVMPTLPITDISTPETVIGWMQNYGFYYTNNFESDSPTWQRWQPTGTYGLATVFGQRLSNPVVKVTVDGKIYVCDRTLNSVYISDGIGQDFRRIFSDVELRTALPSLPGDTVQIHGFGDNPTVPSQVALIGGSVATPPYNSALFIGGVSGFRKASVVFPNPNIQTNLEHLSYGSGGWLSSGRYQTSNVVVLRTFDGSGNLTSNGTTGIALAIPSTLFKHVIGCRGSKSNGEVTILPGDPTDTAKWNYSVMTFSNGNNQVVTNVSPASLGHTDGQDMGFLACDPVGMYVMADQTKSTDGGATWANWNWSDTTGTSTSYWTTAMYSVNASTFIASRNGTGGVNGGGVFLTTDFAGTWVSKSGNLPSITGVANAYFTFVSKYAPISGASLGAFVGLS